MTWDAFWLAVTATVISAATLLLAAMNNSRRTVLESMRDRIDLLEKEKRELVGKMNDLEREVRELQRNNRRLQNEISRLSDADRDREGC